MSRRSRFLVGGVGCLVVLSGCAGVPPAQVAQTAGTIIGSAIAPGVGAPIGSLVGLLAGMVLQGQADKATETQERQELGSRLGGAAPSAAGSAAAASQGEPTRVWVDEAMHDGRLLAGHFDVRSIP